MYISKYILHHYRLKKHCQCLISMTAQKTREYILLLVIFILNTTNVLNVQCNSRYT